MTSLSDEPLTVKAVHNFKGANNDELNFNRGDFITVTQAVDGGWWEGTLNGLTGWFPSNYVKEIKESTKNLGGSQATIGTLSRAASGSQQDIQQEMKMYRAVVFKDIVDTESHHVKELTDFFHKQLTPLKHNSGLPEKEWSVLVCNMDEVLDCHSQFLASLEGLQELDGKEQKIGGCFMSLAPQLKKVHLTYCSNHPKAVAVMERNKDALSHFMEATSAPAGQGTPSALLPLATGLSAPFRRLEKYPALLQELQRHTEESHIDRGDTQRAVFVYKDISVSCQNLRRQKELELEVISGNIRNWQGESLGSLGDIIQMGCVSLLGGQDTTTKKKSDHHLVLFSKYLLILSVSSRLSAFIYKTKIPLNTVTASRVDGLEGAPHAFEITGSNQHIVVSCSSKEEQEKWLHLLNGSVPPSNSSSSALSSSSSSSSSSSVPCSSCVTPKMVRPMATTPPGGGGGVAPSTAPTVPWSSVPPVVTTVTAPPPATSSSHISQLHITLSPNCAQPQQQQPAPPPHQVPVGDRHSCLSGRSVVQPISSRIWSMWSLRPQPPQRSAPPVSASTKKDEVILRKSQRKKAPAEEKWYEEDMRVLQVIEAYCNSAKTRFTVNSALIDTPQVIIAEDEKIIVEEMRGSTPVVQEKSLVDTVYALKDQVKDLKEETSNLSKGLEEERRCRKKLEELVKKHILGGMAPSRDLLSGKAED